MAKSELKVEVTVDSMVQDAVARVAGDLREKHGVELDGVSCRWDRDMGGCEPSRLVSVSVETTKVINSGGVSDG